MRAGGGDPIGAADVGNSASAEAGGGQVQATQPPPAELSRADVARMVADFLARPGSTITKCPDGVPGVVLVQPDKWSGGPKLRRARARRAGRKGGARKKQRAAITLAGAR